MTCEEQNAQILEDLQRILNLWQDAIRFPIDGQTYREHKKEIEQIRTKYSFPSDR